MSQQWDIFTHIDQIKYIDLDEVPTLLSGYVIETTTMELLQ